MSWLVHKERIVTGLVLAAILAGALFFGGLFLCILILAVALTALWELYAMVWPGSRHLVLKILGIVLGALMILASWLHALFLSPQMIPVFGTYRTLFPILAFLVAAFAFLFRFGSGDTEAKFSDVAFMPLGFLYIPTVLSLAFLLWPLEQLLLVLAAIGSDTGAYFIGCRFGRHKIWPSVSPKKSWEGAVGGLILCILICCAIGGTRAQGLPVLSLPGWALIGVLLGAAAQLGDFFESALKRSLNIKDSGSLLPGHGGVLDRVDSLLFVLPAYVLLINHILPLLG